MNGDFNVHFKVSLLSLNHTKSFLNPVLHRLQIVGHTLTNLYDNAKMNVANSNFREFYIA